MEARIGSLSADFDRYADHQFHAVNRAIPATENQKAGFEQPNVAVLSDDFLDEVSSKLQAQFPEPPPVDVNLLEDMGRQALMLGRKELPPTLVVLDEIQQFIRQDSALTLKIQIIAERLSGRFDGRVLLVVTGQQALSDVPGRIAGRMPRTL